MILDGKEWFEYIMNGIDLVELGKIVSNKLKE